MKENIRGPRILLVDKCSEYTRLKNQYPKLSTSQKLRLGDLKVWINTNRVELEKSKSSIIKNALKSSEKEMKV